MRTLLVIAVWFGSAAAAVWLSNEDAAVADAPGQVMAEESKIAAVESGRLAELPVHAGERVEAGQLLARLDTQVLEREIAVAQARLKQLGAETQASAVAMESDGYASERSFQADLDDVAGQLDSARADQARQAAELKHLEAEIARQTQFVRQGLAKVDRIDDLEIRRKTLADGVAQWPGRIDALQQRQREAGARLDQWRTQHRASTAPVSREARLQPLRDRIAEQVEALRVLRTRLESAKLVAPASGDVVTLLARQGDVVRAGEPFLLLSCPTRRVVVAYVNERDGNRITAGTPVLLRRRTPQREEVRTKVIRVADVVAQVPQRFWLTPMLAQWGREVYLEAPIGQRLDTGEAVDVKFLGGAQQ
ncbi:MAG: HlyD family efflux transporter periplasmic adaptor subunit [Bryobacterales bacterium]|nr:HlyD family efflux transporter periplasmic adaptor subunit [Bryobacterales bacterium]